MPLSEDDQRRLDEIERALQRDDPKFAAGHPPSSGSGGATLLIGRRRG
jgi:Protein of unknown function (DUF3040)